MLSAKEKKFWLRDQLQAGLSAFTEDVQRIYGQADAQPRLATQYGDWNLHEYSTRRNRIRDLGNPTWYTEVVLDGPTDAIKPTVDGKPFGYRHRYLVTLLLEYKANTSPQLFEDMTDENTERRLGILPYLRNIGITNTLGEDLKGHHILMDEIEEDNRSVISITFTEGDSFDLLHRLIFGVGIRDLL